MKFSYKILLWTMIVMAAGLGFSGYFFVNYVFETSLEREINQAMDESSILQFAFETAALNVPAKYGVLQDAAVEEIGSKLETSGQGTRRLLRITDEERTILFASAGFLQDMQLLDRVEENARIYQVIPYEDHFYVQTGSLISVMDRMLYLETMKDVTDVFEERTLGFAVYRRVTLLMLVISAVLMYFISSWLTKPIRLLTAATRQMAEGEYGARAKRISDDELGQLTLDYNKMANALEENIHKLEDEIRAREDFIAAFAHELKTPLTAIIGYADLLRSRKLDADKQFLSANYIYTEGRRLETMSFRLLDIIVTRRSDIRPERIAVEQFFQYIKDMFEENVDMEFAVAYEPGWVWAESSLIKTVLLNLMDNACKASSQGGKIEILGAKKDSGYEFTVRDYGVGIPLEEQKKITEAFYMVDKSRSRSRNGAGLGLALCTEILRIHDSSLQIISSPGQGTSMSFVLPEREEVHSEEN